MNLRRLQKNVPDLLIHIKYEIFSQDGSGLNNVVSGRARAFCGPGYLFSGIGLRLLLRKESQARGPSPKHRSRAFGCFVY
jgi:hypothetical protein